MDMTRRIQIAVARADMLAVTAAHALKWLLVAVAVVAVTCALRRRGRWEGR